MVEGGRASGGGVKVVGDECVAVIGRNRAGTPGVLAPANHKRSEKRTWVSLSLRHNTSGHLQRKSNHLHNNVSNPLPYLYETRNGNT